VLSSHGLGEVVVDVYTGVGHVDGRSVLLLVRTTGDMWILDEKPGGYAGAKRRKLSLFVCGLVGWKDELIDNHRAGGKADK
jgi:hypothetical protein